MELDRSLASFYTDLLLMYLDKIIFPLDLKWDYKLFSYNTYQCHGGNASIT